MCSGFSIQDCLDVDQFPRPEVSNRVERQHACAGERRAPRPLPTSVQEDYDRQCARHHSLGDDISQSRTGDSRRRGFYDERGVTGMSRG
jgi:hypothetical protein